MPWCNLYSHLVRPNSQIGHYLSWGFDSAWDKQSKLVWTSSSCSGLGSCLPKEWHHCYLNILNDHAIPSINLFFPDGQDTFQDERSHRESSGSHCEKVFQRHHFRMDKPTKSQDLYPMENLWDALWLCVVITLFHQQRKILLCMFICVLVQIKLSSSKDQSSIKLLRLIAS